MAQGPLCIADVDTPGEEGKVIFNAATLLPGGAATPLPGGAATPLPGGRALNMQLSCHCPITDLRYLALCLLSTSVVGKIAVLTREKDNHFDIH